MKHIHRTSSSFIVIALSVLLLIAADSAHAQQTQQTRHEIIDTPCYCNAGPSITKTPTNAGTDFLLCFEQNNYPTFESGGYLEVYVASLNDPDTVTITCKSHPSFKKVFFLQPNSSISYDMSDDLDNGQPMRDLWIVSDEVADNTVVEVQATSAVVCYGLNYKTYTADAVCAISAESAATDYRVISYPNSNNPMFFSNQSDFMPSQFAVAAFQDNTTVTITPSVATRSGNPAGVPFKVTLQHGQCVQVQTDPSAVGADLTGSMISSSAPVTVYGSHARTEVPYDWVRPQSDGGGDSRDMLLETMPPTSDWGNNFVLNAYDISPSHLDPNGDLMRVLALNDNTTITVNGQPWTTLNHNGFKDSIITSPVLVSSTGPLLVGEIEHTDCTTDSNGDPFLAIVPPVDESYNNFTFFLANDNNFQYQSVTVAADTACERAITIDGLPVSASKFSFVGAANGEGYGIAELPLSQGVHTINTSVVPSQAFTILAHGDGNVVSYGYTAGSLLVPKRAIMIEYPPVTNGHKHSNIVNFHASAYQPPYLDSAVFVPNNPADAIFGIHPQENVGSDIGRINIGASAQIHLVPSRPLTDPVSGTVKIYCHMPSYFLVQPAEMAFTVYPESEAGVSDGSLDLSTSVQPNPFLSYTIVNFSMPESGDVTMTLYDELGRPVRHIASSEFPAGPYSIRVDRNGLPNGVYVCEIISTKLNIHTRIKIVAGE